MHKDWTHSYLWLLFCVILAASAVHTGTGMIDALAPINYSVMQEEAMHLQLCMFACYLRLSVSQEAQICMFMLPHAGC